jgi:hypothetical protein
MDGDDSMCCLHTWHTKIQDGQLGAMNDYPLDSFGPTRRLRHDLQAGFLVDSGDQTFAHDWVIVGDKN